MKFLTYSECDHAYNSIKNQKIKIGVLIMWHTGLRVSEMLSLKWQNIDFKNKNLTVLTLKSKEKNTREIPLSALLIKKLVEWYNIQNPENYSEHILTGCNRREHLTRQVFNSYLKKTSDEVGIRITPHSFRHSFASQTYAKTKKIEIVRQLLGHTNLASTTIYAAIPKKELEKSIQRTYNKFSFLTIFRRDHKSNAPVTNIIAYNHTADLAPYQKSILEEIIMNSHSNKNILLLGKEGLGKSVIIQKFIEASEREIMYFDDMTNLKQSLLFALTKAYNNNSEKVASLIFPEFDLTKKVAQIQKFSIPNLTKELIQYIDIAQPIIVIDKLDNITAKKSLQAIELLAPRTQIVASARTIPYSSNPAFWDFHIIRIKELTRADTIKLIRGQFDYSKMKPKYIRLLQSTIYEQSNGNPRAIIQLCNEAKSKPIDSHNILNLTHNFAKKELDLTYFFLFVLLLISGLRYMARPLGMPLLRLIGGIAFITLVFFRMYFFKLTKKTF